MTRFIELQTDKTHTVTCWSGWCCVVVTLRIWLREELGLNLVCLLFILCERCDFRYVRRNVPAAFTPRGKDPLCPLYRRLGGPQNLSGHRG